MKTPWKEQENGLTLIKQYFSYSETNTPEVRRAFCPGRPEDTNCSAGSDTACPAPLPRRGEAGTQSRAWKCASTPPGKNWFKVQAPGLITALAAQLSSCSSLIEEFTISVVINNKPWCKVAQEVKMTPLNKQTNKTTQTHTEVNNKNLKM